MSNLTPITGLFKSSDQKRLKGFAHCSMIEDIFFFITVNKKSLAKIESTPIGLILDANFQHKNDRDESEKKYGAAIMFNELRFGRLEEALYKEMEGNMKYDKGDLRKNVCAAVEALKSDISLDTGNMCKPE